MTVAATNGTQKLFQPPSYTEFKCKFDFSETSTEMSHPITEHLSEVMEESVIEGMELLLQVDEMVLEGYGQFIPKIEALSSSLAEKISRGGRIFLIGSGSSGRVGIVTSKLCKSLFNDLADVIKGVLSGGDSVMIKPRENYEDNDKAGEKAFDDYNLGPSDTVFLISASGSATFNAGAGHAAANAGAEVFYFYNSKSVPDSTQKLFTRQKNPITPLCIDIGPQAIAGSTRLQAATLANAALGALFAATLYKADKNFERASSFPIELLNHMKEGFGIIRKNLSTIAEIVSLEKTIFSHPLSNFSVRPGNPKAKVGYVTFIAEENTIQTVFIDATESSPTFSLPPMLREDEANRLLPTYAAYIAGARDNVDAWEKLLGRKVSKDDLQYTESFLLAKSAQGNYSWDNRPTAEGNLVFGVVKITKDKNTLPAITGPLLTAKRLGAKTCLIILSQEPLHEEDRISINSYCDALVCLDNLPKEWTPFSETILLKQILNLISNSAMTLMGRVEGNLMTAVRAANNKLIARVMTLIKKRWEKEKSTPFPRTDDELFHLIHKRMEEKKNDVHDTKPIVKDIFERLETKMK